MPDKHLEYPDKQFRRRGNVAVLAEILAGIIAVSVGVREEVQAQAPTVPNSAVSAGVIDSHNCIDESKIEAMEKAFLEFGDTILGGLDEYVADPLMREKIRGAFAAMRVNPKHPRCTEFKTAVPFGQEDGFSYQFVKGAHRVAAFQGKYRVMQLDPNFDYRNPAKLLDLLHELVHVGHDDQLRRRVAEKRYMEVHSIFVPMIVIPKDEAEAIAIEVEVANVMTKGALKAAALIGKTAQFPAADETATKYLNDAAFEYYRHTPAHFLKFVESAYRRKPGTLIFDRNLNRIP